jgi:hypothetical protein
VGSVGGWLHRVAYHAALKARERASAREKHERQAASAGRGSPDPADPADPLTEVTGRELLAVLDEELGQLSEKYRAPLVLCYLEGRTCDEAAGQLGWSLGTFKRRLEQAREKLRARLARRGLALPAVLLAAGLTAEAAAAVPRPLAAAAVRSALPAAAGAPAAPLAQAVLSGLAAPRLQIAGALLALAAVLALAVAASAHRFRAGRETQAGREAAVLPNVGARKQVKKPLPAAKKTETKPAADGMVVSGTVRGPHGKAVAGATVAVLGWRQENYRGGDLSSRPPRLLARGKADGRGRFRLRLPPTSSQKFPRVVALAGGKGYSLGWQSLNPDKTQAEVKFNLLAEEAIRGRFVDLQGQGAAGVKVYVSVVGRSVNGNWQGFSLQRSLQRPPKGLGLWPAPAVTDKNGRFALRGLNHALGISLGFDDDRFAPQGIYVDPKKPLGEIRRSLSPAQLVTGRVLYMDTGLPVRRARLTVYASEQQYGGGSGVGGQADAKGRFRINPHPGKYFQVTAYAPDGEPYLTVHRTVKWVQGQVQLKVTVGLPRGVLVRGKVTEKPSGRPVAGAGIQYFPRTTDNPFYRSDVVTGWQGIVVSGKDGTFQIPVFPGRGHLLVNGPTLDYVRQEIGRRVLDSGKPGGLRYRPDAVVELNLPAKARTKDVAVTLRRGVTVKGKLEGPGGKPVAAKCLMFCATQVDQLSPFWRFPVQVRDGQFLLRGCDPAATYPVMFLDPKNRWGIKTTLSGKQAGKGVTVRLVLCGRAKVRYLDKQREPLAKIRPWMEMVITPGPHKYDFKAYQKGQLLADSDYVANLDRLNYWTGPSTDAQGRVTLPALVPGVTYVIVELGGNNKDPVKKKFTVESGKTLDLGDIVRERTQ